MGQHRGIHSGESAGDRFAYESKNTYLLIAYPETPIVPERYSIHPSNSLHLRDSAARDETTEHD
ncbi:MAG TPA: hypothetical protein PKE49_18920 [Leptospiraceae bacterium]|nr:hypothetical protein [Leptospiraceae bacterium]